MSKYPYHDMLRAMEPKNKSFDLNYAGYIFFFGVALLILASFSSRSGAELFTGIGQFFVLLGAGIAIVQFIWGMFSSGSKRR